jgi:4-hydroxy-tetrahydrodipicolinate synthase
VFTYIPTPTKDDGETVDETRLRQVIDYQIEHHVDGICVLGSTGGNGSFSDAEMRSVTAIAAAHAAGRISVIAGTGRAPHRHALRCPNMPRRSGAMP